MTAAVVAVVAAAAFVAAVALALQHGRLRAAGEAQERRVREEADRRERSRLLSSAEQAQRELAVTAQRALGVLEESLKPAPVPPVDLRRQELENAELERLMRFDESDPFDDVRATRPDAAPLEDDGDGPFGIPGLQLDGERWEAAT